MRSTRASSSRRRALPAVLLVAAALACGCWSGRAFEVSRVRESVTAFERAATDGERLLLEYRVELADWKGRPIGEERRAAAIPLLALGAEPAFPVDAYPVRAVDPAELEAAGTTPIALVDPEVAPPPGPHLELRVADGRHAGFQLCDGTRPEAGERACRGPFHAGALYRDHTRWWVYPLLPFAAAADTVLMVPQFVSLTPFFVVGD